MFPDQQLRTNGTYHYCRGLAVNFHGTSNIYQGSDLGLMNKLIKVDLKFLGKLAITRLGHWAHLPSSNGAKSRSLTRPVEPMLFLFPNPTGRRLVFRSSWHLSQRAVALSFAISRRLLFRHGGTISPSEHRHSECFAAVGSDGGWWVRGRVFGGLQG